MPQLNPAFFLPQLIWLAITFAALLFLMAKVALPRVGATLARRQDRINGDLDRAAKLKAEIDSVIVDYERRLAEARTLAVATINAAKDKQAAIAAERQHQSVQALKQQTDAAEARINAAKTNALAQIGVIATETAKAAAQRLIGGSFDDARAQQIVEQVMKGRA